jgi:3-hydroxyisobutyrate dehydrogenase
MSNINTKNYEPCAPKHVAFLGLGVMGFPMAGHLLRAGHTVTVYNRTAAKAQAWLDAVATPDRARTASHPARGCAGCRHRVRLRGQ